MAAPPRSSCTRATSVAGIFNIGMSEYDDTFIFMPLSESQLYFNLGNGVSGSAVLQHSNVTADRTISAFSNTISRSVL